MATDATLRALAAACPAARTAGPDDAVDGVQSRYAASPASVSEASALLRAAAAHGLAVVARGAGTKLDWGAPPARCDLVIDTLLMDHVIEHAAGDLVASVQAGIRLGRLRAVLAKAGQQLALDPPPVPPGTPLAAAPDGGTIGGTLATGAAGPRRLRYGTPRDLVIGITVVRPDGTVARSGGKVVKNVAGYDLGKLFAGSYGTLGLIVEAVFRLHPLPAGTAYVTADCADPGAAHAAAARAVASDLAPSAVEIDRPARGSPVRVGVLLEGDPAGVSERAELMRGLLAGGAVTSQTAPPWWGWPGNTAGPTVAGDLQGTQAAESRSGAPQPGTGAAQPATGASRRGIDAGQRGGNVGTLVRVAFWAAALSQVLAVIDAAAAQAGLDPAVGGSAAAGVIYAAFGPAGAPSAIGAFVSALRAALVSGDGGARPASVPLPDGPPALASVVVVHASPAVRDVVDAWGAVPSLRLMRAVKGQFDPGNRMAPGRFAGGL